MNYSTDVYIQDKTNVILCTQLLQKTTLSLYFLYLRIVRIKYSYCLFLQGRQFSLWFGSSCDLQPFLEWCAAFLGWLTVMLFLHSFEENYTLQSKNFVDWWTCVVHLESSIFLTLFFYVRAFISVHPCVLHAPMFPALMFSWERLL